MGKFEKGNTIGKGRPKGSINKTTKDMQLMCIDLFNNNFNDLVKALQDLKQEDSKLYIDAMMKLAQYCVSKAPQSIDASVSAGEGIVELKFASPIPKDE